MTNRERYANELLDMLECNIGVDKQTGKPVKCDSISCENCLLKDYVAHCKPLEGWLNAEYVEPIKTIKASSLAVDTKVLCWNVGGETFKRKRYFAKVEDGKLYSYSGGATSWSAVSESYLWEHMTLEDGTIILAE